MVFGDSAALILRLAEVVEDELDFGGGEAAAAQVAQVTGAKVSEGCDKMRHTFLNYH